MKHTKEPDYKIYTYKTNFQLLLAARKKRLP